MNIQKGITKEAVNDRGSCESHLRPFSIVECGLRSGFDTHRTLVTWVNHESLFNAL